MFNPLRRLLILTVMACALTLVIIHPSLAAGLSLGSQAEEQPLREASLGGRGAGESITTPLPLASPGHFVRSPAPLLASLAITATKTYTLATDSDGDQEADPGDVLSYTIVITNNGVTTNTGVIFSDTLDPNLSQLGLVSVSPVAFDDGYNANASPIILIAPDGPADLFANDYPGLNPAVSGISSFGGGSLGGVVTSNVAGSTAASANGAVTVNANGSLVFTPSVGFQGVFSFAYRLQNFVGPGDGLVQISVDAPPTVTTTSPVNNAPNVNGASNITINFSENVDISAGGISLDCGAGAVSFSSTPALPASGTNTITLDPTTNLPGLATCTVTVLAANVTDSDANDPPNQLDGDNNGIEGDNYSFSFQVAPTANDDSYNVTPHLTLTSPTSVRANDDPINVTITGFGDTLLNANANAPGSTITTTLSGRLTLNGDGSFTYNPPPDQRNVNDAFFYSVTGGDTATVTLTIQNQNLIWFVDATAAAGGNGTQARPFNLLTGAGSFDAVASDNTGDFIFIADGSYTCGLTLLNNQTVLGDGASSTLQAISGVTPVSGSSLPAFSGTDPTLSNAAGDCLTLGSGNTLRGLTLGDTSATGSDITGTNFGTLTVTETTLNGTGRALNLNNGTFNATLDSLTSTSGVNNVNLVSVSGTATLGSGALSGASSDAFVVNGGIVSTTYSGSISQASNAALVSVSGGHSGGTLTFQTGTLNATNGTGLQFNNADGVYNFNGPTTLNGGDAGVDILNGSTGTFSFGTGTAITNPSGDAFELTGSNANVTYSGAINDSDDFAIDIDNHDAGTVTFQTGAITSNGVNAQGIRVQNSNAGTINFNNPTKTLNTGANTAVTLSSNTGATINFTNGGLDIDTTSGQGFSATGGGTINVTTGATPNTVDVTTGTAINIANTAIGTTNITFTRINRNGGSVVAINLDGSGTGQFLVTGTGTTAGSGGTIDNITNADAIVLNNTGGLVSLRNMIIEDISASSDTTAAFDTKSGVDGIHGQNVNGGLALDSTTIRRISDNAIFGGVFSANDSATVWNGLTINNSTIEDSNRFHITSRGDANNESMIRILGIRGTVAITNSTLQRGAELVDFFVTAGTLTMTATGSNFHHAYKEFTAADNSPRSSLGGHCIDVTVQSVSSANVTIGDQNNAAFGNSFLNCAIGSVRVGVDTGGTGTVNMIVARNSFTVNDHNSGIFCNPTCTQADFDFAQGGVVGFSFGAAASAMNVIISNNTFDEVTNASGGVGQVTLVAQGGAFQARVNNNTFDTPGNAPWFVRASGNQSGRILFQNNQYIRGFFACTDVSCDDGFSTVAPGSPGSPVFGYFGPGLRSLIQVQSSGSLDIRLDQEDFVKHDVSFDPGNTMEAQVSSGALCLHLTNNTSPHGYALEQTGGTLNLQRGASATTGTCTAGSPGNCRTVLADNGNTGGDNSTCNPRDLCGNASVTPPDVDVIGTVTLVAPACAQPSGGIFQ